MEANTCAQGLLNIPTIARLNVDLQAGTQIADDKLAALVQVESVASPESTQPWFSGSFVYGWERTSVNQSWKVSASSKDDLKVVLPGSTFYLRAPAMTKTVDYVTARSQVTLAMRYERDGGSVLVSTPAPLSGTLNHAPEPGGTVEFRGANGVVRVSTQLDGSNSLAIADLLLGNSTTPAKTEKYAWLGWSGFFLWWDGQGGAPSALDMGDFGRRLYMADPASASAPGAVFRLQFTAPPVELPQLFYRFSDITRFVPLLAPGMPPLPSAAAAVEQHGALLLLRPAQALGPGRRWALETSRDGVTWLYASDEPVPQPALDIVVSDAEGHHTVFYSGYVDSVDLPALP